MTQFHSLSQKLANARTASQLLSDVPNNLIPQDAASAYRIQHEILALQGARISGWKIGSKSPTGPIQGAPLPHFGYKRSGAHLERAMYSPLGLELEIAFTFEKAFLPAERPYADEEVYSGIGSMCAAIEIVSSRYADWPDVDKLAQLADLQNHGALVVGDGIPYRDDFPFFHPTLRWSFNSDDITPPQANNPAGDPRRLLPWLVNHCTQDLNISITPDMIVTTGSYTGMYFPTAQGIARGAIDGLPPVDVEFV